ncbi:MAG: hypothetical protein BGP09_33745 [Rhizobium sp. 60-20]|jgi:hypothetical protein|nr:MAG: hypothetical protein BGP09_33745 [Rhizobium sp. 60-20]
MIVYGVDTLRVYGLKAVQAFAFPRIFAYEVVTWIGMASLFRLQQRDFRMFPSRQKQALILGSMRINM